jgi:hypothetical protein
MDTTTNKAIVIEAHRVPYHMQRWIVRRAVFSLDGATFVAIENALRGPNFEVYTSDDGLEMFAGYLHDVARQHPQLAMAAVEALATV